MKPTVEVCLSPELLSHHNWKEKIAIVIDVLRATSTICAALNNGANKVIPLEDLKVCLSYKGDGNLVAAERGGIKQPGFDLGNSPLEYSSEVVKGKNIYLTTTNGTKCCVAVENAEQVWIASFLNCTAISKALNATQKSVLILCSGWQGNPNLEDSLLAGGIIAGLNETFKVENDSAQMALSLYQAHQNNLFQTMTSSQHYRRLGIDADRDLKYCLQSDLFDSIPKYKDGSIII